MTITFLGMDGPPLFLLMEAVGRVGGCIGRVCPEHEDKLKPGESMNSALKSCVISPKVDMNQCGFKSSAVGLDVEQRAYWSLTICMACGLVKLQQYFSVLSSGKQKLPVLKVKVFGGTFLFVADSIFPLGFSDLGR